MSRSINRVMLDLETMGNSPNAAIIAIGAAYFDNDCILGDFYTVIDLKTSVAAGLQIDASTVMWWMQRSDDARKQFDVEGIPLRDALEEFAEWIGEVAEVWGNGAGFDNVILRNAYRKCGMESPWSFRNDRCYRTMKNLYPDIKMAREGVYHCAVDDAISQANHLIEILNADRRRLCS